MIASLAFLLCSAAEADGRPVRTLSMLTYNVHALPWPLEMGRGAAMLSIAARLRDLRRRGTQPDVVVMQEAFTPAARAIGRAAGYRYVSYGPVAEIPAPRIVRPADREFLVRARYLAGERSGKHVGSGLAIFSDHPILAARQMAYPLCAGYDCLANKGILAVELRLPGIAAPVTVIDTHLNSNKASGVGKSRSLYAYRRQLDTLVEFVRAVAPGRTPILIAGDFNVGRDPDRRAYFADQMKFLQVGSATVAARCRDDDLADVTDSRRRNKDWLMYRGSGSPRIVPIAISAPFGRTADGSMLSDHIGIAVTYHLTDSTVQLASR